MASTVMTNIMSGSGTSMRSGTTSMRSGASRFLPRGFDGGSEEGEGDVEVSSNRFSNNYGRSSGGGGGGYSYPDSTASSCASGVGLAPDDIDRDGGGSAGESCKKDHPLPRGTPSRGTPSVSSRSHRKGKSLADSSASTISGGDYPAAVPSRIAEGSASSTTTDTATATDATPQRDRLDRGESDDPFATSFSEFSSGGSRRTVVGPSATTPRRAGAAGDEFKGEAPGVAGGVAGGGGRGGGRGRGAIGGRGGGVSTANLAGVGGGRGDPDKILEMLVGA